MAGKQAKKWIFCLVKRIQRLELVRIHSCILGSQKIFRKGGEDTCFIHFLFLPLPLLLPPPLPIGPHPLLPPLLLLDMFSLYTQAGFELLAILPPGPPKCWNCSYEPPHPVNLCVLLCSWKEGPKVGTMTNMQVHPERRTSLPSPAQCLLCMVAVDWQSCAVSMWGAGFRVGEREGAVILRVLRVSLANFLFPCVLGVGQSVATEKHW